MRELWIGVDGGGTKTSAAAATKEGEILAEVSGPSLHFLNLGMKAVRENLQGMVESMLAQAPGEIRCLSLGLAALDGPGDEALSEALALPEVPGDRILADTDVYTALVGGCGTGPGLAVICGTGSMAMAVDGEEKRTLRGGYGHALGDAGSSFRLASLGIQAAAADAEGWGPGTALTAAALNFFQAGDLREVIPKVYTHPFDPAVLASFAREVLRLSREDEVAGAILKQEMETLALQASSAMAGHGEIRQVCLFGGVFEHSAYARELFSEEMKKHAGACRTGLPELPPLCGAILLGYARDGMLTEERKESLARGWKDWKEKHHAGI